jgi:hypothetical protein
LKNTHKRGNKYIHEGRRNDGKEENKRVFVIFQLEGYINVYTQIYRKEKKMSICKFGKLYPAYWRISSSSRLKDIIQQLAAWHTVHMHSHRDI